MSMKYLLVYTNQNPDIYKYKLPVDSDLNAKEIADVCDSLLGRFGWLKVDLLIEGVSRHNGHSGTSSIGVGFNNLNPTLGASNTSVGFENLMFHPDEVFGDGMPNCKEYDEKKT